MIDRQTLQGHWDEIKQKLHQRWSEVSDDDLQAVDGDVEQLIGVIQQKSGAAREEIEQTLDQMAAEASSRFEQMTGNAREVGDRARQTAERASEAVRHKYGDVERAVQHRPTESLAMAFGCGLIAGVVVGLMLRSR